MTHEQLFSENLTALTLLQQWRNRETGECVRVTSVDAFLITYTLRRPFVIPVICNPLQMMETHEPLDRSAPEPEDDDVIQAEIAAWWGGDPEQEHDLGAGLTARFEDFDYRKGGSHRLRLYLPTDAGGWLHPLLADTVPVLSERSWCAWMEQRQPVWLSLVLTHGESVALIEQTLRELRDVVRRNSTKEREACKQH